MLIPDKEEINALLAALRYEPASGKFFWTIQAAYHIVAGAEAGTYDRYGYRIIRFGGHGYGAHRLAFAFVEGEWPTAEVDHINMDRADNRWVNLRKATRAQNQWNRKARTAFGKGVYFHKQRRKFAAVIRVDGKRIHLGLFSNSEDAQAAYKAAALKHHGEFARLS